MTFVTPTFLVFLVVVYVLYWSCRRRGKNLVILASSLVFYGWWDWRFLLMLLFIAGVDYYVARALMSVEVPWKRRVLLGVSLASNLGALGFFKYCNFFVQSLHDALGVPSAPLALEVILPIGISFYTFQALSYTIDVYRKQLPAVDSMVEYFSFITFFPHMVAGPIQQAKHLLVQFEFERTFDAERSADGLRQMLWGYFKKMVVADNLAPLVNAAYGHAGTASGNELLWASYAFAFQIYCDFSGYTDIAIGCARLFGLNMTRNFAYPYFATNIRDFWRRWHISLSTWFREYLYIPLGGNRLGARRAALNAFIVFVVSGFWHGANWTFLIWGALHGAYFFVYTHWFERPEKEDRPVRWPWLKIALGTFVTFQLVCVAWVFFRADNCPSAVLILRKAGEAVATGAVSAPPWSLARWVLLLLVVEWIQRQRGHGLAIEWLPTPVRWAAYYGVVILVVVYHHVGYIPFIYFQF